MGRDTVGTGWDALGDSGIVDGTTARVLLAVDSERTRNTLIDALEDYDFLTDHDDADGDADLVISDGESLTDPSLAVADGDSMVARPVLLVADPATVSPETPATVDDVVSPDAPPELLRRRVETLLETRRLSLELARQNRQLDAFASAVSHDLRNPLTIASGRLELVSADSDDPHLEKAVESLDKIEAIVTDVRAMSRNARTVAEFEPVRLRGVVGAAWGQLDAAATLERDDIDHVVLADESRLEHLFEYLFENALRHGGDTVRAGILDDGFYVEDDGDGIPEDDRSEVFEGGYTTDDGTGFGLTVVEGIVAAHGWTVTVSESDTGGARFEIRNVEFTQA